MSGEKKVVTQDREQEMLKSTLLYKYWVGGYRNSKVCVCSAIKVVHKRRKKIQTNHTWKEGVP